MHVALQALRTACVAASILALMCHGVSASEARQAAAAGPDEPGWLGITTGPVDKDTAHDMGLPKPEGVLVEDIDPRSPAAASGLLIGDILLGIGAKRLSDPAMFDSLVHASQPGTELSLSVWHDGREQLMRVSVKPKPSGQPTFVSQAPAEPAKPVPGADLPSEADKISVCGFRVAKDSPLIGLLNSFPCDQAPGASPSADKAGKRSGD